MTYNNDRGQIKGHFLVVEDPDALYGADMAFRDDFKGEIKTISDRETIQAADKAVPLAQAEYQRRNGALPDILPTSRLAPYAASPDATPQYMAASSELAVSTDHAQTIIPSGDRPDPRYAFLAAEAQDLARLEHRQTVPNITRNFRPISKQCETAQPAPDLYQRLNTWLGDQDFQTKLDQPNLLSGVIFGLPKISGMPCLPLTEPARLCRRHARAHR